MAYTDIQRWPLSVVATGVEIFDMVQAANTVLWSYVVPTGHPGFTLQAVEQQVAVVMGGTTAAQIKIYKKLSGGSNVLLKTCTANGLTDAVGTTLYDRVVPTSTTSNQFAEGDTLEIQVAVTATSTGKTKITLHIAPNT